MLSDGIQTPCLASEEEILQCQFEKWYNLFEKCTIRSRVIPLTEEFINYLGEDGVILPETVQMPSGTDDHLSDDEDLVEVIEENDASGKDFSLIEKGIQDALESFGNEVFIKLNWSAPIDASWVMGGSLKCRNLSDIYILLKSSDRIIYDTEKMFSECVHQSGRTSPDEFTLVVRKWANLAPSMEFRVFIHNKKIAGICQRDCTTFYPFLLLEKSKLQNIMARFFIDTIQSTFPLDSYVVDLYIDKKERVWIIDFNTFGNPTCPLMFEWDDLKINDAELNEEEKTNIDATVFKLESNVASSEIEIEIEKSTEITSIEHILDLTEDDFDFEFLVVESPGEVLTSAAGSSRGPIDVHASSDFPKFFEIWKQQNTEDKSK